VFEKKFPVHLLTQRIEVKGRLPCRKTVLENKEVRKRQKKKKEKEQKKEKPEKTAPRSLWGQKREFYQQEDQY
jgi:hypothetical protein